MSIKIVLADDHGIMREGLRVLLERQPNLKVVATAEDGRKALALVREHHPDIVIMDISMPNLNGIDTTRFIAKEFPETKVIALSMHSNQQFVSNMLKAGASGYILKECLFDELIKAVQTVTAGEIYLSSRITGVVVKDYLQTLPEAPKTELESLSTRERQVLQMLAEGNTTKQIALELHVSVKTIEAARRQIMEKLDIYSIAKLTKYAVREGLTSLET